MRQPNVEKQNAIRDAILLTRLSLARYSPQNMEPVRTVTMSAANLYRAKFGSRSDGVTPLLNFNVVEITLGMYVTAKESAVINATIVPTTAGTITM